MIFNNELIVQLYNSYSYAISSISINFFKVKIRNFVI